MVLEEKFSIYMAGKRYSWRIYKLSKATIKTSYIVFKNKELFQHFKRYAQNLVVSLHINTSDHENHHICLC